MPKSKTQKADVKDEPVAIRWMIRRDMPEVLEIETGNFKEWWLEEDFLVELRKRNSIGMIAERDGKIVGFMVYELYKTFLQVLKFVVDEDHRRSGVGVVMVEKLLNKLSQQRRQEIAIVVRESNLPGQLFLREMKFICTQTIPGHYIDTDEDGYEMRFLLPKSEW